LIKELRDRFPGSYVTKVETYIQGFPDLLILFKNKWAMLECKVSPTATHQPWQDEYVADLNRMSFAAFIYPENKEDILDDLEQALFS
jgi:hypothetical protein